MVRSVAYIAAVVLGVIRAKRMVTSSYRSLRKLMTIHKARVYAKSMVLIRGSSGEVSDIYYMGRYYPVEVTGSHWIASSVIVSKTAQSLWHMLAPGVCGPVLDSRRHKACTYSVTVVTEDTMLDEQANVNARRLEDSHLPPEVLSEIYARDEKLNELVRGRGGKLSYMTILSLATASRFEKNLDAIRAEYSRIEKAARQLRKGRWH